MATRVSKEVFAALKRREIEMYNAFIKACDILIENAPKWDGKILNVRYTRAMDEAINKEVEKYQDWGGNLHETITFTFDNDYNGNRERRFRMFYNNRYVSAINAYIPNYETIIYQPYKQEPYITEDNRLDAKAYIKRLTEKKEEYSCCIRNGNDALEHMDDAIKAYDELNHIIKDMMSRLPEDFRQLINCQCPIY